MSITHSQAAKQAATDAVTALVDAGTGAGKIVLKTAADAVVATFELNDPAFGAANASGTATLDVSPAVSAEASAAGIVTKFDVTDSDDNVIFSGTAGESAADMILDNNDINEGQTISISSFTYDSGEA
jgi:hypothetical protein